MQSLLLRKNRVIPGVFSVLIILLALSSCRDPETRIIPDNDPPYYDGIPTAQVQNYVNRMYIDLIGRDPLDQEMAADVQYLQDNSLSEAARDSLVSKLQFDRTYLEGDSSLSRAYYHRLYELCKGRLIEGASDAEIRQRQNIQANAATVDSLLGDSIAYEEHRIQWQKYEDILTSDYKYYDGQIGIKDMYFAMLYNGIYDVINMNTFNFINASFDDLFLRYPTQDEYDNAFLMIEYNLSGSLFQRSGQNKVDYCNIMLDSREYHEGLIRWAYLSLLAREPSTEELSEKMNYFFYNQDFQRVQREIMVTDEYANF